MTSVKELLNDKSIKSKEKVELLAGLLLDKKVKLQELSGFAMEAKDPVKATCIEAMEYATRARPELADESSLHFATKMLSEKAPRVKWESAKVIGNIAHLFPKKLDEAIAELLVNSEHAGTVVRWSAAFALAKIVLLGTKHNSELVPALEAICIREEKNSIRKIYLDALKKLEKQKR